MAEPRWTVDEWGYLRWDEQVIYRGEGPYPLKYEAAYDALVAAVRDADTLRQARKLAGEVVTKDGITHVSNLDTAALGALLDLLAPSSGTENVCVFSDDDPSWCIVHDSDDCEFEAIAATVPGSAPSRISVLQSLVVELASGANRVVDGHWWAVDENHEPHYDNGPLTAEQLREWEALEVGE